MKISIIIPAYNSEFYISKLLDTINAQTYLNYEVIIVNDGSTDKTEDIIKEYMKKNNRIVCYNIKNSGPGNARRIGFKKSTGDLLFFIDSDDYLVNNMVFYNINKIYSEYKYDILFFNCKCKLSKKSTITNAFKKKMKKGYLKQKKIYDNNLAGALWQKIFLKKLMREDYFINTNTYEDYYTTYMYLNNCSTFYYTNDVFYYSDRVNPNSLSNSYDICKVEKTIRILKDIKKTTKYKRAVNKSFYEYYVNIAWYYYKKTLVINNKIEFNGLLKSIRKNIKFDISFISFSNIKNIVKLIIFRLAFWSVLNEK